MPESAARAEVLAELSASALSRLRRLIFFARGATLAAELTGHAARKADVWEDLAWPIRCMI